MPAAELFARNAGPAAAGSGFVGGIMSEGDIGASQAALPAEPGNTPAAVPAQSAPTPQQNRAAVPARKQTAYFCGAVIAAGSVIYLVWHWTLHWPITDLDLVLAFGAVFLGAWLILGTRTVRRVVAGLLFLGIVAGIFGTLGGVLAHRGRVLSVPAQTGSSLTPGNTGSTTKKPVGGASLPGVAPASLGLEIGPIDVAAETIPARVDLSFPESLVSHLRWKAARDRAPVPLAAVPYHAWAQLPVGIWLTMCVDSSATLGLCGTPTATISLGQLLRDGGKPAAVPTPVILPISGTPNRYPSDVYVLDSYPQLTLPSGIVLATAAGGSVTTRSVVSAQVSLYADAVFGDRWVTASQYGQEIKLWIADVQPSISSPFF